MRDNAPRKEAGGMLAGRVVHRTLPATCAAAGIQADPALRLAGELPQTHDTGGMSSCAACAWSGCGGDRISGCLHAARGACGHHALPASLHESGWRKSGPGVGLPSWPEMAWVCVMSGGRTPTCSCVSPADTQLQRFLAVDFLPTQPFIGWLTIPIVTAWDGGSLQQRLSAAGTSRILILRFRGGR